MIGMVLVTHGRLAEELKLAMEHVVGPQTAAATVCIGPEDDMETRRRDIRDCIAFPKTARGTDLMTGAPGTVDARQLKELHLRPV